MPGPPPNPNARRRNARPDWVTLPAEGRNGPTPRWPLSGRTPRGWVDLWRLPQALMWDSQDMHVLVARYLLTRSKAHDMLMNGEDVNASLLKAVTEFEDRLGLSPMALKRLQWEIGDAPAAVGESEGKVIEADERFKRLLG